jgi:hypothetical protein
MTDILDKYDGRAGMPPSRVVIHKTGQYHRRKKPAFARPPRSASLSPI